VSIREKEGRPLQSTGQDCQRIDFYQECDSWVVVSLDRGWEWKERREAQISVSRRLWCPGFLVFVYDGNYWGYEFFAHGKVFDHFVQEAVGPSVGFPGEDCRGKPELIVEHIPSLQAEDFVPYLVQMHDWVVPEGANIPARPGDEFGRFEECAVVDFLRMLGVPIRLQEGYVCPQTPVFRSAFKVTDDQGRSRSEFTP